MNDNNEYVQEYEERIERAFKDMRSEGIEDYDSYAWIDEEGGFTDREIVGHYLYSYPTPRKALCKWIENADSNSDSDKEITLLLVMVCFAKEEKNKKV